MKEFVSHEIRKAIGRLRRTLLWIVKGILIAAINGAFLLMPLVIIACLVFNLLSGSFDGRLRSTSLGPMYPQPIQSQNRGVNLPDILRSAEDVWRTLRNLGRI